jgi:thiosulfate/3-mercaptopyruvate sulfurtransferase|tara:strand:+ start:306 stop:1088 length:783 start_codon:yes stop_codon:yes gene_type:complete
LISTAQLERILDQACVLDCRASLADPLFGERAFAEGHISGAQRADLDADLASSPGSGGRHPLPDAADLSDCLRRKGLNEDAQLIVYDDAGGAFAARAWWLARWLGHENAAVLDGGISAWRGPLEKIRQTPNPGTFRRREALTRIVRVDELTAPHPYQLIDARAENRFHGIDEPIDPVAGHIPGAICRPFQQNLDTGGHFLPPAALRQRFSEFERPVCYCGSGVTAAHNVLAMRHAGLPESALYPGSWSEWILDPTRPVAT